MKRRRMSMIRGNRAPRRWTMSFLLISAVQAVATGIKGQRARGFAPQRAPTPGKVLRTIILAVRKAVPPP